MTSIRTNYGAMNALASLRQTNAAMATIQEQISTGKKVNSAKDNAAVWSMAKKLEGEVSMNKTVGEGLAQGQATLSIGRASAENVTKLLGSIREKVVQAQDPNADRAALEAEINEIGAQITSVMGAAEFNGQNVLLGTGTMKTMSSITRSKDASGNPTITTGTIDVTRQDLGTKIDMSNVDFTDDTTTASSLTAIDSMLSAATSAASTIGAVENRMSEQSDFLTKLNDIKKTAIAELVDADITEASAELIALQTRQQLGVQALAIANQQPALLLQLFR